MTPSTARRWDRLRLIDWGHLKSEFTWAYEGAVEQPYRNTHEHHQGQSALLLCAGSLTVETDKGSAQASQGQWVFPHEGRRLQRFSDDARVLSVHFSLYWPGNQPLFNFETALVLPSSASPQLEKQARFLCRQVNRRFPGVGNELPWRHGNLSDHLALQRSFAAWLCVYVDALMAAGANPSRLGTVDERVILAVQTLDELPVRVALDEAWLAAEVGLSVSQLDRLFGKQYGLTPRQYFERRKLERAKDLIRSAPLSIKQIAYETGFRSMSYFSRWFHTRTGMSPRAFQKVCRSA